MDLIDVDNINDINISYNDNPEYLENGYITKVNKSFQEIVDEIPF